MSDTVKVRIAVAVDVDGIFAAFGDSGMSDYDMAEEVAGGLRLRLPMRVSFIEADVPLPEQQTVKGKVTE